jgi:hypothetical protein
VRVRPDVGDAQAVKTLAHELAHIECGHTAHGFDYRALQAYTVAPGTTKRFLAVGDPSVVHGVCRCR